MGRGLTRINTDERFGISKDKNKEKPEVSKGQEKEIMKPTGMGTFAKNSDDKDALMKVVKSAREMLPASSFYRLCLTSESLHAPRVMGWLHEPNAKETQDFGKWVYSPSEGFYVRGIFRVDQEPTFCNSADSKEIH